MSAVNNIFYRYDYLCTYYANKIWNNDNPALEKADIIQELRLKLFVSISTYLEKYEEYLKSGKSKPIPLEFYLRTVMINRSKDLIREITRGSVNFSIEDSGFHFGNNAQPTLTEGYDIKVGFQSLLELFDGDDRTVMKLFFIKDFNRRKLLKLFKNKKLMPEPILESGLEKIRLFLETNFEPVEEFSYFEVQE